MDLTRWWTDSVSVQPYLGAGSMGPTFGSPVSFLGYVVQARKLVLDAQAKEVTAEMTVWVPPSLPGIADTSVAFRPESLVSSGGRTVRVITCKPFTRFGVVQYVELTTT